MALHWPENAGRSQGPRLAGLGGKARLVPQLRKDGRAQIRLSPVPGPADEVESQWEVRRRGAGVHRRALAA